MSDEYEKNGRGVIMENNNEFDMYRKLEPVSRVLRALAIPPPEAVILTPKEIMDELGIRTPETILAGVKDDTKNLIVQSIRKLRG